LAKAADKAEEVPVASPAQPSSSSVGVSSDKFGEFGQGLTAYHVGDSSGLVGLLISVVGFYFSIREAKGAKDAASAAESAAKSALQVRDRLEIAALLGELSGCLKDLRDVSQDDDWSTIGLRFDRTESLVRRAIGSSHELLSEEDIALTQVREVLHRLHLDTNGVKDTSKRSALKKSFFADLHQLVNEIESLHTKRLKNGT
jgi:hypothetical protein